MSHKDPKLTARLTDAATKVSVGGQYRHYKELTYKVLAVALREDSLEPCVVYQAEYGDKLTWTRSLSDWLEQIEINGKKVDRFTLLA